MRCCVLPLPRNLAITFSIASTHLHSTLHTSPHMFPPMFPHSIHLMAPHLITQCLLTLGVDLALGGVALDAGEVVALEEVNLVVTMERTSVTVMRPNQVRLGLMRFLLAHLFFMLLEKPLHHFLDHLV